MQCGKCWKLQIAINPPLWIFRLKIFGILLSLLYLKTYPKIKKSKFQTIGPAPLLDKLALNFRSGQLNTTAALMLHWQEQHLHQLFVQHKIRKFSLCFATCLISDRLQKYTCHFWALLKQFNKQSNYYF